jgi:hypothetical protein
LRFLQSRPLSSILFTCSLQARLPILTHTDTYDTILISLDPEPCACTYRVLFESHLGYESRIVLGENRIDRRNEDGNSRKSLSALIRLRLQSINSSDQAQLGVRDNISRPHADETSAFDNQATELSALRARLARLNPRVCFK